MKTEKLTKEHLQKIIKEELQREGFFDRFKNKTSENVAKIKALLETCSLKELYDISSLLENSIGVLFTDMGLDVYDSKKFKRDLKKAKISKDSDEVKGYRNNIVNGIMHRIKAAKEDGLQLNLSDKGQFMSSVSDFAEKTIADRNNNFSKHDKEIDELGESKKPVTEAKKANKTEHSGAKKGKGAYWGPKKDAKKDSKKQRRRNDKEEAKIVDEAGHYLAGLDRWSRDKLNKKTAEIKSRYQDIKVTSPKQLVDIMKQDPDLQKLSPAQMNQRATALYKKFAGKQMPFFYLSMGPDSLQKAEKEFGAKEKLQQESLNMVKSVSIELNTSKMLKWLVD